MGRKMENQSGSVVGQALLEPSLMMSKDEKAEYENTVPGDTTPCIPPKNLQETLAALDNNTNVSGVNVLLPQ